MAEKVIITNFTDPACTWCWGEEPEFKRLLTHYGEQIEIRYVMGGLVEDFRNFIDTHNSIGGRGTSADQMNRQVAQHWEEASSRHGMPVNSKDYHLMSDEYPSTYPQNIAYKAAQIATPEKADKFLRRMREATAAEAQVTSRLDVQTNLADEVGINTAKFLKAIKDGSAEEAFKADMALTRAFKVTGFPTFLIEYGDNRFLIRGYHKYDDFKDVIDAATDGKIQPTEPKKDEQTIFEFIKEYGPMAPIEVQTAFDLSEAETKALIDKILSEGKITKEEAGNGYFISAKSSSNPLVCDATTRICG